MALPADTLIRLNVTFLYDGQNCINSFWARMKPTTTATLYITACQIVANEWYVNVWPNYKVSMVPQVQLIGVVAQTMNPSNSAIYPIFPVADFGSRSGDGMPSNCAAVLSWYSQYPGRRTHGRIYIPGISELDCTLSRLNTTGMATIKNLADTLLGRYGDTGSSPEFWFGIYSRKNGVSRNIGPPPFLSYDPTTHYPFKRYKVNDVLGTQRHRMQHRGV
jgi:hypothetical protein